MKQFRLEAEPRPESPDKFWPSSGSSVSQTGPCAVRDSEDGSPGPVRLEGLHAFRRFRAAAPESRRDQHSLHPQLDGFVSAGHCH